MGWKHPQHRAGYLHTAAMCLPTSDLLRAIESFDDFEYAVEAAAKNRAKMSVTEWVDANVRAPVGRRRDAMTTTVTMKTSPEPTEAEMVTMVNKLRASPVARKWLATQKLARAISFDPIGDHVREHRPRGLFAALDDAGDSNYRHADAAEMRDRGWFGKHQVSAGLEIPLDVTKQGEDLIDLDDAGNLIVRREGDRS